MLKKIKNFFKWIADHTGISWILGKLGWQSTGQEEDFVMVPEQYMKKQTQERQNGTITSKKELELIDTTIQEKEQEFIDTADKCISKAEEGWLCCIASVG